MRVGVFGTGMVGQTLGTALVGLGHEVMLGSRQAGNDKARAWVDRTGERSSEGSFADSAAFGELIVNATAGVASIDAITSAGAERLAGKVLVDVANPLDFSKGMPPTLTVSNTDSLGEQIQRAFPDVRVVKTLNTMSAEVMVDPGLLPSRHSVFVCGNDAAAKARTVELLRGFGWPAADIIDLGDIVGARGTEMYLPLWLCLWAATGTGRVNVNLVTPAPQ